jgi:predicted peptidase
MRCRLHLGIAVALGVFFLAGTSSTALAAEPKQGFTEQVYKDASGTEHKYVLFVPHDYKGDKAYPLILFLHGAGETEGGKRMPVEVGIGPAIKKLGEMEFPFFVLIPQAKAGGQVAGRWGAESQNIQRTLAMLEDVQKNYKIDAKRLYLTGLSMGGYGTWSVAAKYPDKWAAIVPICGGGDPKAAEKIKHIPCWCFHGEADKTVPAQRSRDMIQALKAAGGNPKYDEYPGVGHNSWDQAYGTKELYAWLLQQSLK